MICLFVMISKMTNKIVKTVFFLMYYFDFFRNSIDSAFEKA